MTKALLAAALLACTSLAVAACGGSSHAATPTLVVGLQADPSWAQVPVAQAEGLFRAHHLNVRIEEFPTGVEELNALKAGALDVATPADVPTAPALAADPKLRVIADGSRWNASRIVARKASGITSFKDLQGKKIGTPEGTSAQYFADAALAAGGIKATTVQTSVSTVVSAITNGNVDAVSVFEPYQIQAEQALGNQAVVLKAPGAVANYSVHSLYVTSVGVEQSKAPELRDFLAAIKEATPRLTEKQPAAIAAVSKSTGLSKGLVSRILPELDYHVVLDPRQLGAELAAYHKWAAKNDFVPPKQKAPNYTSMIDTRFLTNAG